MSSIKPPDVRPPVGAPTADGADGPAATEGPGPSFQEVLQGGEAPTAAHATAAHGSTAADATRGAAASAGADPIAELAQAVRNGELSADQAIERLVERAAGEVSGHLGEAQRAELLVVLRQAIESDPALRELREAL